MHEHIINKLKEAAEYAERLCSNYTYEIFCAHNDISTIRIATNEIIESKNAVDNGIGIRIVKDNKQGFASTGSLDKDSIKHAAEMALLIAEKNLEDPHFNGFAEPQKFNHVPHNKNLFSLELSELNDYAKIIIDNKGITRISGSVEMAKEFCVIKNSIGVDTYDTCGSIQANITAEVIDVETATGIGWFAGNNPKNFNPEKVAKDSVEMALRSRHPSVVEPGIYTIIFEPIAMADILQLLLSAVSSPQVDYGLSFFKDDLNQFIATDEFNLIDDGRHVDGRGTKSVDDEGTPTQRTELIFNGTLKHFIFDKYYGDKLKFKTTGNGFRVRDRAGRAYSSKPQPNASNLILENGSFSAEDLIEDTSKGILIPRIWYTYPLNPQLGDFSTTTRGSAFLIENGQIVKPLDKIRIFDNIKQMITTAKIANDQRFVVHWGSECGLASPTIAFDNVKVSTYDESLKVANN